MHQIKINEQLKRKEMSQTLLERVMLREKKNLIAWENKKDDDKSKACATISISAFS